MKRVSVAIGLLSLAASLAWGDVTFNLYVNGTTDTALEVAPGGSIQLWVRLNADSGEQVAGAAYDVQLPMEGWTLASREYGDYGWYEEDGTYDGSIPVPSGTPIVILDSTYNGPSADTPDFWFNTARSPYPSTVTGWATCEVFEIAVPHGTTPGTYSIDLGNPYSYDLEGAGFDSSAQFFDLTITPEPASVLLVLAGVAVIGAGLRRRR